MPDKRRIFAVWLRKISLSFAFLSGIAMLLMMVVGTLDIIGTNVFALPIPAAFEFIATMMVVVVFFAVSLAQARRANIRVEVVFNYLPRPLQFLIDIFQYILNTLFFGAIAYFGWRGGFVGFAQGEFASGIVNFPIWPARFALALGASLMTVQCCYDLASHLFGWKDVIESPSRGPQAPV
jgi:TRAP-type C4-dicarboxylate transport system permease small subunit